MGEGKTFEKLFALNLVFKYYKYILYRVHICIFIVQYLLDLTIDQPLTM